MKLSIVNFLISLKNACALNKSYVEFAINDKCNKIYDVAVNQNNICTKLRVGINTFLRSLPVDDSTVVAFIKNIHQINKIEKCKLEHPYTEITEKEKTKEKLPASFFSAGISGVKLISSSSQNGISSQITKLITP